MKMKDITDLIVPIGLVALGYIAVSKLFGGSSPQTTQKSAQCPRGISYNRSLFDSCDVNYSSGTDWFGFADSSCNCLTPASISQPAPSLHPSPSATPAPNPLDLSALWDWITGFVPGAAPAPAQPSPSPVQSQPVDIVGSILGGINTLLGLQVSNLPGLSGQFMQATAPAVDVSGIVNSPLNVLNPTAWLNTVSIAPSPSVAVPTTPGSTYLASPGHFVTVVL
jgi:hypothetical protein